MTGSCYFYRESKCFSVAETCLMSHVFGFQCALCPSCEAARERVGDNDEKRSSSVSDSGERA